MNGSLKTLSIGGAREAVPKRQLGVTLSGIRVTDRRGTHLGVLKAPRLPPMTDRPIPWSDDGLDAGLVHEQWNVRAIQEA
jgi:hypothetical protein